MCLQTVYFYPFNGKALVYEIVCPVTYGFTSINSSGGLGTLLEI